jgi:membrane protein YdbS with pleckstrin-like domain
VSENDDRGLARWIYGGVWATLTDAFRVPRTPPTLPATPGRPVESFRPSEAFLRYLKLKFWLVLTLVDGVLVILWITLAVHRAWIGAAVALPVLVLVVLPDVLAYVAIHLRYDTTWYVLSDRSLRIRRGVMVVVETTITFENVQNVKLKQGPLQRRYGIASLIVETAGGGAESDSEPGQTSHVGLLEGLDDAARIRDLILDRVQGRIEEGSRRSALRWPERHARALVEARDAVTGRTRRDELPADALPAPGDSEPDRPGAVERAVRRLLRVAERPPTLPAWAGKRPHRFRPARSYLGYELLRAALTTFVVGLSIVIAIVASTAAEDWVDWSPRRLLLLAAWSVVPLAAMVAVALFTAWMQYRVTWYVIGDRGLRLRRGVWILRETTITYDNVQNVNLRQGPLERLFGIWSVAIHTAGGSGPGAAGGGGGGATLLQIVLTVATSLVPGMAGVSAAGGQGQKKQKSAGTGVLSGIEHPAAIREFIMSRVRASRVAGLGDEAAPNERLRVSEGQLDALREIRREVRRLAPMS